MADWLESRMSKEQADYVVQSNRSNLVTGFVCGLILGSLLVSGIWTYLGLLQWGCGQ